MHIDELIDRYFEGETSVEEEREIRAFFSGDTIPPHLAPYKPLFGYFDAEINRLEGKTKEQPAAGMKQTPLLSRRMWYTVSGIAASLLLMLGAAFWSYRTDPCPCRGNYALVDGRCYTDIQQVRTLALEALQEVSSPTEDYFIHMDDEGTEKELVHKQLEALGRILSDDN